MGNLANKDQAINNEKKKEPGPNTYFSPPPFLHHQEMQFHNNPFSVAAPPPKPNPNLYNLTRSEVFRKKDKENPFAPYQNLAPPQMQGSFHSRNQISGYNTQIYSPTSQIHYPGNPYSRISISPTQRDNISLAHPLPISQPGVFNSLMRTTGPPKITTETFNSPGGLGRRTIIEEPFEIDQPPKLQKMRTIVNRPISIPQHPDTHIIEEVIESPVIVHPPPQKQIIREVIERPISIPQPPERRIIREVFKRPIQIQPSPERKIIHDIVRRSVLVHQPPKPIMLRKEYEEPPQFFEEVPLISNFQETMIPEAFSFQPVGSPIPHHQNFAIPSFIQNGGPPPNHFAQQNVDEFPLRYPINQPIPINPQLPLHTMPEMSNNVPISHFPFINQRFEEFPYQPDVMTNLGGIPPPSNPIQPIHYDIVKDNLVNPQPIIPDNPNLPPLLPPKDANI